MTFCLEEMSPPNESTGDVDNISPPEEGVSDCTG